MVTFVPGGVVSFTISPSTVNFWIKPDVPPQSPMSPWTVVSGVEKSTLERQTGLSSTRTANLPKAPRLQIADEYAVGQIKPGAVGVGVGVGVGVLVGVEVGVFVGVEVGVFVGVEVGVFVGVEVGVFVGVDVAVAVGVGVGVGEGMLQSTKAEPSIRPPVMISKKNIS